MKQFILHLICARLALLVFQEDRKEFVKKSNPKGYSFCRCFILSYNGVVLLEEKKAFGFTLRSTKNYLVIWGQIQMYLKSLVWN